MFYTLMTWSYIVSISEELIKNYIANDKIKKQGYDIVDGDRNVFEKTIDFIKDYFYIAIPFYNAYRGSKELFNYKKFTDKKMSKLKERGRLKKHEEKEEVKIEKPKTESKPKIELPKIKTNTQSQTKIKLPEVKREYIGDTGEYDLPEVKIASLEYESTMLADLDRLYRREHASLKAQNASVDELNKIARKLHQIRKEYDAIQNQIRLIREKEQSMKLTLK